MVSISLRQWPLIKQDKPYHRLQFFHVVTAFFNTFNVFLKRGREYRLKHLYAQLFEHVIRIFGVMQSFTLINSLK